MKSESGGFVMRSERVVHEWGKWRLVSGNFADPTGRSFERTYVQSPGAVGVVALAEGSATSEALHVMLVRQFRPALGRVALEIPAGMRDVEAEDPLVTAQRELREEVGRIARRWTALGAHVSSPGISNSQVALYLAEDLSEVAVDRHGPEEDHMTVEEIPFDDAVAQVRRGEIGDAKTAIGLLLVDAILRER